MLKRTILIYIFLFGSFLPIMLNVMIFALIIMKRQLQQVRFYIIANLTVADVFILLISCTSLIKGLHEGKEIEFSLNSVGVNIVRTIGYIIYFDSIITTALLAIDRYIAVKYVFRYGLILTKRRIYFILGISWLLSGALASVLWVDVYVYNDLHRNVTITLIGLRLIVSFVLLGVSKYTNVIRRKHIKRISKRRHYFGVQKEKIDRLKNLKSSIKDSFKFYIATFVLMSVLSLFSIIELILLELHFDIKLVVMLLSLITDVLVVSLTYRKIRAQLKYIKCLLWQVFTFGKCLLTRKYILANNHYTKIEVFPLRISSVNVTKFAISWEFGRIY